MAREISADPRPQQLTGDKGQQKLHTMARTERAEISRPWRVSRKPAIRGVRKTPSRFEAEALHSAAGTLPPATDVKAIEA